MSIEVLDGVDPYKQGYSYQEIINFRRNQIYSQASQSSQDGASLLDDITKNEAVYSNKSTKQKGGSTLNLTEIHGTQQSANPNQQPPTQNLSAPSLPQNSQGSLITNNTTPTSNQSLLTVKNPSPSDQFSEESQLDISCSPTPPMSNFYNQGSPNRVNSNIEADSLGTELLLYSID